MPGLSLGLGLGLGSYGGTSAPTPTPTPAPSFPTLAAAIYDGDSRTNNQGGRSVGGGSLTITGGYGTATSSSGFIQSVLGNPWLLSEGYMRAIGASSTEGMRYRAASTSMAQSGNPAFSSTALTTDAYFNRDSDGRYTLATDPAKLVISGSMSVNDTVTPFFDTAQTGATNALAVRSLENIAWYVDQAATVGKTIVIGNEFPRGRSTYQMESKTPSGGTVTATNTNGFVDGETYGAPGVIGRFATGTPRRLTKVASAPGQDQYTVSSSGVYTFGGTAPTQVWLNYTAIPSGGAIPTGNRQLVVNAWANSSAANFVDPVNSVSYGLPGLKNGRSNVIVADTFNALLDTGTGTNRYSLPGTMDNLQLHHTQLGALKAAKAFKAALEATYGPLPSLDSRPTRNNWYAARGTGLTTSYSGTLPPTMRTGAPGFGGATGVPTLITLNGAVIGQVNPSTGAITALNGSTAITSGTLNWATGAWSITASSNGAIGNGAQLWFEQDIGNGTIAGSTWTEGTIGRNAINNPLLDPTAASGTNLPTTTGTSSITGISNAQVPYGWTLAGTALNTAIANSTATISVASDTTADGYPRWTLQIEGSHTASVSVSLATGSLNNLSARIAAGDRFASGARVTYANHATIGGLWGTTGAESRGLVGSSPGVTRDSTSGQQTITQFAGRTIDGGTGLFVDSSLVAEWGGSLDLYRVAPLVDLSGVTFSTSQYTWTVNAQANIPFAGGFSIGQAQMRRRNDVAF